MERDRISLMGVIAKSVVVHTVTYFLVGFAAYLVFDYATVFKEAGLASYMRPTDDALVRAGTLFQPLRGILFGLALYPLRSVVFERRNGWAVTWLVLVTIGIFSTFGPTPGSIEGLIYTTVPVDRQLWGLVEILLQSLLLSSLLFYWVRHPDKRWLRRVLVLSFALVMLLPTLGLLAASPEGRAQRAPNSRTSTASRGSPLVPLHPQPTASLSGPGTSSITGEPGSGSGSGERHVFSRMLTLWPVQLEVARSILPSPLKSPAET